MEVWHALPATSRSDNVCIRVVGEPRSPFDFRYSIALPLRCAEYFSLDEDTYRVHESAKTTSKEVARDAERQRRRKLEETWNGIEKRMLPPRFDQAAAAWLADVKPHLAIRTHDIYEVALENHPKPELGSLQLCHITSQEIARNQAKRVALDVIALAPNQAVIPAAVHQNGNQLTEVTERAPAK